VIVVVIVRAGDVTKNSGSYERVSVAFSVGELDVEASVLVLSDSVGDAERLGLSDSVRERLGDAVGGTVAVRLLERVAVSSDDSPDNDDDSVVVVVIVFVGVRSNATVTVRDESVWDAVAAAVPVDDGVSDSSVDELSLRVPPADGDGVAGGVSVSVTVTEEESVFDWAAVLCERLALKESTVPVPPTESETLREAVRSAEKRESVAVPDAEPRDAPRLALSLQDKVIDSADREACDVTDCECVIVPRDTDTESVFVIVAEPVTELERSHESDGETDTVSETPRHVRSVRWHRQPLLPASPPLGKSSHQPELATRPTTSPVPFGWPGANQQKVAQLPLEKDFAGKKMAPFSGPQSQRKFTPSALRLPPRSSAERRSAGKPAAAALTTAIADLCSLKDRMAARSPRRDQHSWQHQSCVTGVAARTAKKTFVSRTSAHVKVAEKFTELVAESGKVPSDIEADSDLLQVAVVDVD
jgi:hypothetical protein